MIFRYFWFDRSAKSNFEKYLIPVYKDKENLRFLEIGSFEGRSTVWMLENVLTGQNNIIIVIEPFLDTTEHNKGELEIIFKENIKPYKDRVYLIIGKSQNILDNFKDVFDFIYIDGSHRTKDVYIDAINSFKILKKGGIMAFDDYLWERKTGDITDVPKPGIDKFLESYEGLYDLLVKKYQVWIKKI